MNARWDRCTLTLSWEVNHENLIPRKKVTLPMKSTVVNLPNSVSNSFSTPGSLEK